MLTVVHATVNYKITQAQNPKKFVFVFFPPSPTHHVSHLFSKNKKKCFANIKFILIFFLTEGRCLLELTHRSNNEGQDSWVPVAKKVYWPPVPVKAESSPSVHSGKLSFALRIV